MRERRILYIGPASGTCQHRADTLRRLGHTVEMVDPRLFLPPNQIIDRWIWRTGGLFLEDIVRRRLLAHVRDRHFDLVFVNCGELLGPALVKSLKQMFGPVINYNIDDPFGRRDARKWRLYLSAVPFYDLTVVLRKCNVAEAYKAGAVKALHVTMSADEVAHAPRTLTSEEREELASEVLFMGTWMPERGPFMARLVELGVRWQSGAIAGRKHRNGPF